MAQHLTGAARPGVVAGLDQLAVDVDPVGTRPAHDIPARWAMWPSILEVVVLPLVPVIATTGTLGRSSRGRVPVGLAASQAHRRWPSAPQRRPAGRDAVKHRAGRGGQRLGPAGVAPRIGDDQFLVLRSGPGAYREPAHPARPGEPADELGHHPAGEALPEDRPGRSRPGPAPGRARRRSCRPPPRAATSARRGRASPSPRVAESRGWDRPATGARPATRDVLGAHPSRLRRRSSAGRRRRGSSRRWSWGRSR